MDTRKLASAYRLSHWASVMRARTESGLSVRAFCEREGFHENSYYYWQRKLREAACSELVKMQGENGPVPTGFMEVSLLQPAAAHVTGVTVQSKITIELTGIRITADGDYPVNRLAELIREVSRPC
jgi:hypothetical protein